VDDATFTNDRKGGKGFGLNEVLLGNNGKFGPNDMFRMMLLKQLFGGGESEGNEGTVYEDDVNYYGEPGTYVGDESSMNLPGMSLGMPASAPAASPYSDPAMTSQLEWPEAAPADEGQPGSFDDFDLTFNQATHAGNAGYSGAPQDQVALAMKYGQQYGVDPGLLLAIAKHETGFGKLGLGRKGLTLGYGAFDSGASYKWQGPEAQYKGAAGTLSKWGANSVDDVLAGKAASYATDPGWEQAVANAYSSLAPQVEAPAEPTTPPEEEEEN
jgi:hypothetical protein